MHPFLVDAPAAIAHRGGALLPGFDERENTLATFAAAYALGIRYFETDAHATRDGALVAFHDADLSRVTDGEGTVAETTKADLDAMSVGGEPIPAIADLLEAFPDCRFNVDLKAPGAVAPMAALMERTGTWDRVCVASFSGQRLNAYRRLVGPRSATACSPREIAGIWTAAHGGPRRWAVSPGIAAQIPRGMGRGPWSVPVASARFVATAHRAGIAVHVWTIDEPEQMKELMRWGVDAIMSDRPDVLLRVRAESPPDGPRPATMGTTTEGIRDG